jgi:hypothetical protein
MNEKVIKLITENWGLDAESLERFLSLYNKPKQDSFIEDLFSNTQDRRLRFELDGVHKEAIDEGWKIFKDFFRSFCSKNQVRYENFFNNLILVGKNQMKMKKALVNYYCEVPEEILGSSNNHHAYFRYGNSYNRDLKNPLNGSISTSEINMANDENFSVIAYDNDRFVKSDFSTSHNSHQKGIFLLDENVIQIKYKNEKAQIISYLGSHSLPKDTFINKKKAGNVLFCVVKDPELEYPILTGFTEQSTKYAFYNLPWKVKFADISNILQSAVEYIGDNKYKLYIYYNKAQLVKTLTISLDTGVVDFKDYEVPNENAINLYSVEGEYICFVDIRSRTLYKFNKETGEMKNEGFECSDTSFKKKLTNSVDLEYNISSNRSKLYLKVDKKNIQTIIEKDINSKLEHIGKFSLPKNKGLELVISGNFDDWLLCSTEEKWTSCLNLESSFSGAHYNGLPGLVIDKDRVLIYATDGNKKSYMGITADKFLSRTWALLDSTNTFNLIKFYPLEIFDDKILTNKTKLKFKKIDTNFKSKNPLDFLYYRYTEKYRISCYLFLDRAYLWQDSDKKIYVRGADGNNFSYVVKNIKSKDTRINNGENVFRHSAGVKFLVEKQQKLTDYFYKELHITNIRCGSCGTGLDDDEPGSYINYNDQLYCPSCFNKRFEKCSCCGTYIRKERGGICETCKTEYFKRCDKCGEYHDKRVIKFTSVYPKKANIERKFAEVCKTCLVDIVATNLYVECQECSGFIYKENLEAHLREEHGIGATVVGKDPLIARALIEAMGDAR